MDNPFQGLMDLLRQGGGGPETPSEVETLIQKMQAERKLSDRVIEETTSQPPVQPQPDPARMQFVHPDARASMVGKADHGPLPAGEQPTSIDSAVKQGSMRSFFEALPEITQPFGPASRLTYETKPGGRMAYIQGDVPQEVETEQVRQAAGDIGSGLMEGPRMVGRAFMRAMNAGKGYGDPGAPGGTPQLPTGQENLQNAGDMVEGVMAGPKRIIQAGTQYKPGDPESRNLAAREVTRGVFETVGPAGTARAAAGARGVGSFAGKPPPTTPEAIVEVRRLRPAEYRAEWEAVHKELIEEYGEAALAANKATAAGRPESTGGQSVEKLKNAAFGKPDELSEIADRAAAWRVWLKDQGTDTAAFGSIPKAGAGKPRKISSEHMDYMQALARDPNTTGAQAYRLMKEFEGFQMDPQRFNTLFSQFRQQALAKVRGPTAYPPQEEGALSVKRQIMKMADEDPMRPAKEIIRDFRKANPNAQVGDNTLVTYISDSRGRAVARSERGAAGQARGLDAEKLLQEPAVRDIIEKEMALGTNPYTIAKKVNAALGDRSERISAYYISRLLGSRGSAIGAGGAAGAKDFLPGPKDEAPKGGPFSEAMRLGAPRDEQEHTQQIATERYLDGIQGRVDASREDLTPMVNRHRLLSGKENLTPGERAERDALWQQMKELTDGISRTIRTGREVPMFGQELMNLLNYINHYGERGQRPPSKHPEGRKLRFREEEPQ